MTNWNYIIGCYSGTLADTDVVDSNNFDLPQDCVEEVLAPSMSPAPTSISTPSSAELPFKKAGIYMKGEEI